MIDQTKVNRKIEELRDSSGGHLWKEISGYQALTMVNIETSGAVFNPASGVVVKTFVDTVTGEIKIFPSSMFEQNP